MNVVRTVLSSIFIIYVWIWIIHSVFGSEAFKTKLIWKIIITGIVLVLGLLAYKYALIHLWYNQLSFSQDSVHWRSLLVFSAYCTVILLLLIAFFRKWAKHILETLFVWSLFFLAVNYGWLFLGINTLIIFYIVSAYAEEYLKYTSSVTLLSDWSHTTRDLIFFCILLGLGFSMVENVAYLISIVLNNQKINLTSFIVGRWLISTLLHVVATGTIGFIQYRLQKKIWWWIATLIGILVWFTLHSWYNIWLEYRLHYLSVPLIIFMVFLLTYLLFQSDLLYKKPTPNQK